MRKILASLAIKCARLCPDGAAQIAMTDENGTARTVFKELRMLVNNLYRECRDDVGGAAGLGVRRDKVPAAIAEARKKVIAEAAELLLTWIDETLKLGVNLLETLLEIRREGHKDDAAFMGALETLVLSMDLLQLPPPGQSHGWNPNDRGRCAQEDWKWGSRGKTLMEYELIESLAADGLVILNYFEMHRWPGDTLAQEALGLLREGVLNVDLWKDVMKICYTPGAAVNMSDAGRPGIQLVGSTQDERHYNEKPALEHMDGRSCCVGLLDHAQGTQADVAQEFFPCQCRGGCSCTLLFKGSVTVSEAVGCFGCGALDCQYTSCTHKGERRGQPLCTWGGAWPTTVIGGSAASGELARAESARLLPRFCEPQFSSSVAEARFTKPDNYTAPACMTHGTNLQLFTAKSSGKKFFRCQHGYDKVCDKACFQGVADKTTTGLTTVQWQQLINFRDEFWLKCGCGKAWTVMVMAKGHFARYTKNTSAIHTTGRLGKFDKLVDDRKLVFDIGEPKLGPLEVEVAQKIVAVYWVSDELDNRFKPRGLDGRPMTGCWTSMSPAPPKEAAYRLHLTCRWLNVVPGQSMTNAKAQGQQFAVGTDVIVDVIEPNSFCPNMMTMALTRHMRLKDLKIPAQPQWEHVGIDGALKLMHDSLVYGVELDMAAAAGQRLFADWPVVGPAAARVHGDVGHDLLDRLAAVCERLEQLVAQDDAPVCVRGQAMLEQLAGVRRALVAGDLMAGAHAPVLMLTDSAAAGPSVGAEGRGTKRPAPKTVRPMGSAITSPPTRADDSPEGVGTSGQGAKRVAGIGTPCDSPPAAKAASTPPPSEATRGAVSLEAEIGGSKRDQADAGLQSLQESPRNRVCLAVSGAWGYCAWVGGVTQP
jgi:hypothetical protein